VHYTEKGFLSILLKLLKFSRAVFFRNLISRAYGQILSFLAKEIIQSLKPTLYRTSRIHKRPRLLASEQQPTSEAACGYETKPPKATGMGKHIPST
jgi:hypothetical protein